MRTFLKNEATVDDVALTPTERPETRKFLKGRKVTGLPFVPPSSPSLSLSPRFFSNRKPSVKNVKRGLNALPGVNLMEEDSMHSSSNNTDIGTSKVRFDESRNQSCGLAVNGKFSQFCWYNHEEYQRFKLSAMALVQEIKEDTSSAECKYRRIVSCVLTTCCSVDFEIAPEGANHSILCEQDERDFARCLVNANTRFGLERPIVSVLRDDSTSRKRLALAKVQALQRLPVTSEQVRAEMIRRALEPISLPSRWFALEKAKAQMALPPL